MILLGVKLMDRSCQMSCQEFHRTDMPIIGISGAQLLCFNLFLEDITCNVFELVF